MAAKELSVEAREVLKLVEKHNSFLLSGGAGSGKTYSLIEIIGAVIDGMPLAKLACITYTNAAVREIEERIDNPNLTVSTIHEFLWGNIKHFQKELKKTLVYLINGDDYPTFKISDIENVDPDYFDVDIKYKEFVKLKDGVISHDELIVVAREMYKNHRKLCAITCDRYPYIFVDEYQDTDRNVVEILLEHLPVADRLNVVGFFGDAMQSIYQGSVGDLNDFTGDDDKLVQEVKKEQNRRNPQLVIDLANKLRNDGLEQHPSDDVFAPNMDAQGEVKGGECKFVYSVNSDLESPRDFLGYDFDDSSLTKELNLTHNLIAEKAGFDDLMRIYDHDKILDYVKRIKGYVKNNDVGVDTVNKTFGDVVGELEVGKTGKELKKVSPTPGMAKYIERNKLVYERALQVSYDEISSIYVDKDQLVDDKKNDVDDIGKEGGNRDDLIKHLFKIQHNVRLYKENRFNEFLRVTDYKISSINGKVELRDAIDALVDVGDKTIENVIDEADQASIVKIDDNLIRFKEKKGYVYEQVAALPFSQFQKLYEYLEGFTPFSTQHKTKGAEYSDVFVILDNGNWNSYNFEYLFTGRVDKESVVDRTRKIFYVCCTRAKERLGVFYHDPSPAVVEKAKVWFGEENVVNLDGL